MQVSSMGFKQGKKKTNRTNQDSSNRRNNTGFNNKPYIVVTYVKRMGDSSKNICRKHDTEMHFKGSSTIKDPWYTLRTKLPSSRKVGWSTDISVAGWTVKKNIIGNQAELLQKGSENTQGPPHQSMTTNTPLFMTFCLDNFSIVGREDQVLPDPSKKQY